MAVGVGDGVGVGVGAGVDVGFGVDKVAVVDAVGVGEAELVVDVEVVVFVLFEDVLVGDALGEGDPSDVDPEVLPVAVWLLLAGNELSDGNGWLDALLATRNPPTDLAAKIKAITTTTVPALSAAVRTMPRFCCGGRKSMYSRIILVFILKLDGYERNIAWHKVVRGYTGTKLFSRQYNLDDDFYLSPRISRLIPFPKFL